jgi:hypothetical protein
VSISEFPHGGCDPAVRTERIFLREKYRRESGKGNV